MKNNKKTHLIIDFLLITGLVIIDLFTKNLAVNNLKNKDSYVIIKNVFELKYLENTGAAFSMMENKRTMFLIVTVLMMIVIMYVLAKLPLEKKYLYLEIVMVLIFAGAAGNMYDRIINGYVIDFFYFSLINFPIFNVADIYVSVSTFILALLIIFYYKDNDFVFLSLKKKCNEEV